MKSNLQLFFTSFIQVTCVAANVVFIAKGKIVPMFICGFLISFLWTLNVKKAAFGRMRERFIYSFGAMVGTGIGYYVSHYLINVL